MTRFNFTIATFFVLLLPSVSVAQDMEVSARIDAAFAAATTEYETRLREWESLNASLGTIRKEITELKSKSQTFLKRKPTTPTFSNRKWQTFDEKFSTTATLVDTDGTTVAIKKTDGETISVPKRVLIARDRIYVDDCYAQLKEAKTAIAEWQLEYEELASELKQSIAKANAADKPKPVAPDRAVITKRVERSLRGIQAKSIDGLPGVYTAELAIGTIEITLPSPVVWLAQGSEHYHWGDFCRVKLINGDRETFEEHGVLNVNGKPVTVAKSSGSDHFRVEPTKKLGDEYTFERPGNTFLTVQVGPDRIWVQFAIRELPFKIGTPSRKILKEKGFPQSKTKHFTSWPETNAFDGIIYSPSARENIIVADHWKFDSLPYAVLSIVDDRLDDVGSHVERGLLGEG